MKPISSGQYPEGTINYLIMKNLEELRELEVASEEA